MITDVLKKKDALSYKLLIFYLLLLAIVVGAGWFATGYLGDRARQEIDKENEATITLLSVHLTDEFKRIEGAVKAMSGSPWIPPALISATDRDIARANSTLDRYNSAMRASVSYLMDSAGKTIASSNRDDPDSFVGKSYQFRPYFTQAINGNRGRYFALGVTSLKRGFYASFPVRDGRGAIIGVVAMKTELDDIEASLSDHSHYFFINPQGIIFLSSKKETLFKTLWPLSQETERALLASKQFGEKPFEAVTSQEVTDRMNVTYKGNNYLVSRTTIDPEGWSIVLMTPTDMILIYKSIGVIVTLLICTFIIIPLIINYKTARSAEMVRESEERFHRLADSTFEGILIHDKGEILDFNQALLQMFGYEYDEVIGTSVMDYIAPESREVALHHLQTGNENPYEVVMRRKDGAARTMEVAGRSISYKGKTARVVALRDITERKRAEALYKSMTDHSLAAVYIIQDGKFLFINTSAIAYAGYTAEEFIGQDSLLIVHPEDKEMVKKKGLVMLRGKETTPYEFRMVTKQGEVRWIMQIVAPIQYEGKPAILGNAIDITERKRLEEEIHALSITDQLTGLFNRRGFLALAEQQLKIADRTKKELLLFFIDLDGMKWINDNLGHKKGDEALIEAANILKKVLRESDIIARVGGDEFTVLALGSSMEHQDIIINRLQYCIDTENSRENRNYKISLSTGIAYYNPENPCSIDELMMQADKLMYEQKRIKKSCQ